MPESSPTSPYASCAEAPAYPGALHRTPSSVAMSSSYWGALNWTQCSKCGLTREKIAEEPLPWTHWPHCWQGSPACIWPHRLPGHMASSGSACPPLYILSSRSLIKSSNRSSSHIYPWKVSLVNGCPVDFHGWTLPFEPDSPTSFYPINHPLIQALFHQFGHNHIMKNCLKHVLKVKIYNIHYFPFIQSQGSNQVGQGWFFLGKSTLDVQTSFLSILCLDSPLKRLRLSWLVSQIPFWLYVKRDATFACIFLIIRTIPWWSWSFKDDRKRFQADIDQLFQHSWMIPQPYACLICLSGP